MTYKSLTLWLSLMVAAVNVSAQPQTRPRSPDSTDATSAKRAHVDTVVSPVGGPATALADSETSVCTIAILPDDCLRLIFDLVRQYSRQIRPRHADTYKRHAGRLQPQRLRLVSQNWKRVHDELRWPVRITIDAISKNDPVKKLTECMTFLSNPRPAVKAIGVYFETINPAYSLRDFWPILAQCSAPAIKLAITRLWDYFAQKHSTITIEDKDMYALRDAPGLKITNLWLKDCTEKLTPLGMACVAIRMPNLQKLTLSLHNFSCLT